MLTKRFNAVLLILGAISIFTVGCGSKAIGPSAVKLSVELGDRISEMHAIHQLALENSFEYERARIDAVFKEKWISHYLKTQLEDSELLRKLEQSENPVLLMNEWIAAVQAAIERERKERFQPMAEFQKEMRSKLTQQYTDMLKANGVITARLEAAAEMSASQDKLLDAFKVGIMEQLRAESSNVADKIINETINDVSIEN